MAKKQLANITTDRINVNIRHSSKINKRGVTKDKEYTRSYHFIIL